MKSSLTENPANIEAISCKNCGASLPLLGNTFRSKNLCCAYCGTVMDSQNEFKALYTFSHIQRENMALSVGMQGTIQEVKFTITGFIAYKSREEEWMHFQLYSATHGYALLIHKDNRYLFLRKTYYLPDKNLWTLKQADHFNVQQQSFQINHFLIAELYYAAGNLITSVKQNKRNKQCFSQSNKDWFLSIQQKETVEYFKGYEISHPELESVFHLTNQESKQG